MNEYNTKSDISENVVIRTFMENASGATFRFPVVGFLPNDIHATTSWFAKELQPDLYDISFLIPSSKDYQVPRIEIDVLGFSYYPPETPKIFVLPYGMDDTECWTGVNEKGHLVQITKHDLLNKDLFTEVHDRP